MAGYWMKLELSTAEKPEVMRIASALGVTRDDALGKVIRMWSWFDMHTDTGHARGVTPVTLDSLIGCDGFSHAVADVGWLVIDPDGVRMPNFDRHNGESAKKRALATERKQRERDKKRDECVTRGEERRGDKPTTTQASPESPRLTAVDPVPYQRIVDLYHQTLPMLPRVAKLTDARRAAIRARWKQGELPDLETWGQFFVDVSQSKFLTGQAPPAPGRKTFVADLEWLVKEANFVKVWEGKYAA